MGHMVGTRVLVADDDARLAELISRYLTMEGYLVETVATGWPPSSEPSPSSPTWWSWTS